MLLFFCVWICGFLTFISVPFKGNCSQNEVDAIVVLTGGRSRIEEAFKLFPNIAAKRILISGVGEGVNKGDFKELIEKYSINPKSIVLGTLAKNTLENALEAKMFMTLNNYQNLCLVTAHYHLPRSLLIFKYNLLDIKIYYQPVFPNIKFVGDVLINQNSPLRIGFIEYNKLLYNLAYYSINYINFIYYEILEGLLAKFKK
jgi:uncharacterized SAM-binding protein YcdF (DUF218 family)